MTGKSKMSEKKANLAAVSTFADHEVILPPNKLKKAVQKLKPDAKLDFDPVAQAEAALAELASDFTQWMEHECVRLDTARKAVRHPGSIRARATHCSSPRTTSRARRPRSASRSSRRSPTACAG